MNWNPQNIKMANKGFITTARVIIWTNKYIN